MTSHVVIPDYAELHCHSNFSFLRGASHAEELVERAQLLGYTALAITDECSFAGIVRAHVAAKQVGVKLLIGTELVLADGMKLVLLAQNRAGYGNLSAIISLGRRRAEKGTYQPRFPISPIFQWKPLEQVIDCDGFQAAIAGR